MEFSRSGGAKGKGFGWIATLGGDVFGICMPACTEGERTELHRCACTVKFPGPRGGGFDGYSPSAAVFSVYACQGVGRANGVNVVLSALPLLNFLGPGGGIFWQISTTGGGAFGILCMSASQEGELGEPFCFCATVARLVWSGWARGAGFGGSLPSAATLLVYACQRVRRGSGLNFVFALAPSNFPGPGGGVYDQSLPSAKALLVYSCQRILRANEEIFALVRFRC